MNILILTSVYKDKSLGSLDKSTDIVNSFAYSWVEQGHKVIVIHNVHRYPRIVHEIPESIRQKMAAKLGFHIGGYEIVKEKEYIDNGVKIWKFPILKLIPHGAPSKRAIGKQVQNILNVLNEQNFQPDVMVGHWASPQMEIMYELLAHISCKSAIVLHGTGYIDNPKFPAKKYLERIDKVGARSRSQAEQIKEILDLKDIPFVCYSGVPDQYLKNYALNIEKFNNIEKWKFSYVGRLVAYKNIDAIIKSLSQIKGIDWELNIVGEGAEENTLKSLSESLGISQKVKFWGRVPRDQVMQILKDTHCFIMISHNEIFGLAYLEAMAASCITIASKNGGVDGIIVDEKNGFLCQEGSCEDLIKILEKILALDNERRKLIVECCFTTVKQFSDLKVAERYLEIVES